MSKIAAALLIAATEVDVHKVREIKKNSSPRIDMYLRSCGLGPGYAWCACFVVWCLLQAGIDVRRLFENVASTCNWYNWARKAKLLTDDWSLAKRGDLGMWCTPSSWTGHIFWIVKTKKYKGVWYARTIEGNSNDDGSREGVAVVRRGHPLTDLLPGKLGVRGWRKITDNMRVIRLTEAAAEQLAA